MFQKVRPENTEEHSGSKGRQPVHVSDEDDSGLVQTALSQCRLFFFSCSLYRSHRAVTACLALSLRSSGAALQLGFKRSDAANAPRRATVQKPTGDRDT